MEEYRIPFVPDWRWLAALVRLGVTRQVERVWAEDLGVEVCRDGWPGVPGARVPQPPGSEATPARANAEEVHPLGPISDFPPGSVRRVTVGGEEMVVFTNAGRFRAVSHRCPHAGGPLSLGEQRDGTIVCPWHGAVFGFADGRPRNGVTSCHLNVYDTRVEGARLVSVLAFRETS